MTGGFSLRERFLLGIFGALVVGGGLFLWSRARPNADVSLGQVFIAGQLDPDWGSGEGLLLTDVANRDDEGVAFAIQADGKIILVGQTDAPSNRLDGDDFAVVRLTADGLLDPTFGDEDPLNPNERTGKTTTTFTESDDHAQAVAIQADDKILVGGSTRDAVFADGKSAFGLVRYLPDGTLDPTFGAGGYVITSFAEHAAISRLLVNDDGTILAGGSAGERFPIGDIILVRYLPDGTLDPAFGAGGIVHLDLGDNEELRGIALLADGSVVIAGALEGQQAESGLDYLLVRLSATGVIDDTFFQRVAYPEDTLDDAFHQVKVTLVGGEERLIVTGISNGSMVVARYLPDGTLDPAFGDLVTTTGQRSGWTTRSFDGAVSAQDLVVAENGNLIVAGGGYSIDEVTGSVGYDLILARFLADGSADLSFGDFEGSITHAQLFSREIAQIAFRETGELLGVSTVDAHTTTGSDMALAQFLVAETEAVEPSPTSSSLLTELPTTTPTGTTTAASPPSVFPSPSSVAPIPLATATTPSTTSAPVIIVTSASPSSTTPPAPAVATTIQGATSSFAASPSAPSPASQPSSSPTASAPPAQPEEPPREAAIVRLARAVSIDEAQAFLAEAKTEAQDQFNGAQAEILDRRDAAFQATEDSYNQAVADANGNKKRLTAAKRAHSLALTAAKRQANKELAAAKRILKNDQNAATKVYKKRVKELTPQKGRR